MIAQGVLSTGTRSGNSWSRETVNVTNMPGFNDFVLAFGQDNAGNVYIMGTRARGPNGEQEKICKIVSYFP